MSEGDEVDTQNDTKYMMDTTVHAWHWQAINNYMEIDDKSMKMSLWLTRAL